MISRREFMKLSGATVFYTCASAVVSACSTWRDAYNVPHAPEGSYRWEGDGVIVSLIAANELGEVGAAVRLVLGQDEDSEERIIVVHSEEGIYKTFADHCTHNGKEVYYLHEEKLFRCHSGRSYFDLEGNVIKGPAECALHLFPTHRAGDELVIEM
jgi:Rieske Fe-S protein